MALREEENETRAICENLIANDPALTELDVDIRDNDELCKIFNALEQNVTVTTVSIERRSLESDLEVKASLSLAAAILRHPTMNRLQFKYIRSISGFSSVALAIQQNDNLKSLELRACDLTLAQAAELEWLLAGDGIESLDMHRCYPAAGTKIYALLKVLARTKVSGSYVSKVIAEYMTGGFPVKQSKRLPTCFMAIRSFNRLNLIALSFLWKRLNVLWKL